MGLYKIDNVSSEEWQRRQLRRHDIKMWAITIVEILGLAGAIVLLIYAWKWLGI